MNAVDWNLVKQLQEEVGGRLREENDQRKFEGRPTLSGEDESVFRQAQIKAALRGLQSSRAESGGGGYDPATIQALSEALEARMAGAGSLDQLLGNPEIEDIQINGWQNTFVEYADGSTARLSAVYGSNEQLIEEIQGMAAQSGRRFDLAEPRVNLLLPDGSRLYALQQVTKEPSISIRKHRFVQDEATLDHLVGLGTLTPELRDFFVAMVRARKNAIIGGAVKAGKTTLLRALANEIEPWERIATIERARELGLDTDVKRHPNCLSLEERLPNSEGAGHESMSTLFRDCLRLNFSRIIVGEVLGDEVVTMLNAMTAGSDGSLSTIHANSATNIISKLGTYAAQAPERLSRTATDGLVSEGVDFLVHMRLFKGPGWQKRLVTSVEEVVQLGDEGQVLTNEIFVLDRELNIVRTMTRPRCDEDLREAGWTDGGHVSTGAW